MEGHSIALKGLRHVALLYGKCLIYLALGEVISQVIVVEKLKDYWTPSPSIQNRLPKFNMLFLH